jgi:predicted PurR-regulated permease PerM
VKITVNIDNRTIVRVLAVVVLFLFGITFISATKEVLSLLVISAFLAMALNPPVSYLSSKITGGSRGAATGIAYLVVVSIISVFLWAMIPPLITQTREFIADLPNYIEEIAQGDDAIPTFIRDNHLDDEAIDFINSLTDGTALGSSSSRVFDGLGRLGAAIVSTLTVLVLTFFMLVEGPIWLEKFWQLQPDNKLKHRQELVRRMYGVITGYVNGQLLIALLAATASLIVMLAVGLPLPLPLAGIVGLFGLIPLVGATLGSVIVIVIALFQSFTSALIMLVFFLLYQQIENTFIQPYVQSRTLEVSPLLIFVAVLFGISVGGLLGGFVAIPAAACLRILLNDYLESKGHLPKDEEESLFRRKKRKKNNLTA